MVGSRWRWGRARRATVPGSTSRFTERIRQRRLRAARPWLVGFCVVAVLALAVTAVAATPLFGVDDLRVTGTRLVTVADVRAAARVARGTPLARVDETAVSRRIGRLAPVASVTVTRQWPHTLAVRVVERAAAAVVPDGGGYAVIDRTGTVFDRAVKRPAALPVLKVTAPGAGDATTRAALTVLGALPPRLRALLIAIAADSPARIRLNLRDGRQIIWGDATLNDAKGRVAEALLGQDQRVLDVSAPAVIPTR
ncbi:MAG: cell division protein FtsQ [Micromonosporaceae bacterium]|jgi:cell division protein FtsQ|nr:cell division protein FtsQ [Micromonosporaceae bacterium]MDT5035790.1 cell division protein FtsQ [Micromonosporaceae bacterium]